MLGPRLLEISAPALSTYAPVAPLGFALLLVGASIPYSVAARHRAACAPFLARARVHSEAARATADTLRAAKFDFSAYTQKAVLASPHLRGLEPTDFEAPRGSIEYGWAR